MEQRVLKFRVWDKVSRKMSPPFALFGEFTLLGAVHAWQYDSRAVESTESTVETSSLEMLGDLVEMQFSGMKDNKGNEIYEGDILEGNFTLNFDAAPRYIVCFVKGAFRVIYIDETFDLDDLDDIIDTTITDDLDDSFGTWTQLSTMLSDFPMERIGDIYQNPSHVI